MKLERRLQTQAALRVHFNNSTIEEGEDIMLDQNKVAEANAAKKTATAGGPPGTRKLMDAAKQLGKLIEVSVPSQPQPKQATVAPKGKAMKWAIKKFGQEGVITMAQGTGMSPKKWAKAKYAEHIAAKEKEEKPNEAMQALVDGAAKKAEKKVKQGKVEAAERQQKIDGALLSLKVSTNETLKNALHGFIDGPVKLVMDRLVNLFVSRKTEGDSDEAVLALDACRLAFDACGLILTDVETKSKAPKNRLVDVSDTGEAAEANAAKKPTKKASAKAEKKERVRKPLTKEQREAKNKKDRDRRAKNKKK